MGRITKQEVFSKSEAATTIAGRVVAAQLRTRVSRRRKIGKTFVLYEAETGEGWFHEADYDETAAEFDHNAGYYGGDDVD